MTLAVNGALCGSVCNTNFPWSEANDFTKAMVELMDSQMVVAFVIAPGKPQRCAFCEERPWDVTEQVEIDSID